ncbi:MAG: hypothetical protein AAF533_26000 [Acidobacteriota bacterium]
MSGLEQEFPGRVVAQNVDAFLPESKADVQALGFANHGLVIRSASGETLWSKADHAVKIEEVRTTLKRLLEERS